jgi:co-chaperonin GroES (HSP10)
MIVPRNTLCVLRLIDTPIKHAGSIVIPTGGDQYTEAEVMAVGPGNLNAAGGRTETFDLKVGQIVLVKHKRSNQRGESQLEGFHYRIGQENYYIFEQTNVLAIIREPANPVGLE